MASIPLKQLRRPLLAILVQLPVVEKRRVLQPVDVQRRCQYHVRFVCRVFFRPIGVVVRHPLAGVNQVSRLGKCACAIDVYDGPGSVHDDGEAELDARQRPLGIVFDVVLSPEKTRRDDAALREAYQSCPFAGALVLIYSVLELLCHILGRNHGVHLLVGVSVGQPPLKWRELGEDVGYRRVRFFLHVAIDKDESKLVLELAHDGSALDFEDLGIDARAVDAENARQTEILHFRSDRLCFLVVKESIRRFEGTGGIISMHLLLVLPAKD